MRAVIFDMDGVIVDSEIHWRRIECDFLQGLIPGWNEESQKQLIGMSMNDAHELLVRKYGLKNSLEEFQAYYADLASSVYGEHSDLIPGALATIVELHAKGVILGIASSSPHEWIDLVLKRFSLERYFSVKVSADDVHGRGKPSPDVYLLAAERLGVLPENCVAVEDTDKGVQSAKQAGMRCVGLRNENIEDQTLEQADVSVSGFGEQFLNTLDQLMN